MSALVHLEHAGAHATVDPQCGGTVRQLSLVPAGVAPAERSDAAAEAVLVDPERPGPSSPESQLVGQGCRTELFAGRLLVPFADRIIDARYPWDGTVWRLAPNDVNGRDAIHGFLYRSAMSTISSARDQVTLLAALEAEEGYPWKLEVAVTYRVAASRFTLELEIVNRSDSAAPLAPGWHPYLKPGKASGGRCDDWTLHLDADTMIEVDEDLVPSGRLTPVAGDQDLRQALPIGAREIDTGYRLRGPDGRSAAATAPAAVLEHGSRRLELWCEGAFAGVQVFTPPQRDCLALEPVVGPAESFRYPQLGLLSLAPGQRMSARTHILLKELA